MNEKHTTETAKHTTEPTMGNLRERLSELLARSVNTARQVADAAARGPSRTDLIEITQLALDVAKADVNDEIDEMRVEATRGALVDLLLGVPRTLRDCQARDVLFTIGVLIDRGLAPLVLDLAHSGELFELRNVLGSIGIDA